MKLGDYIFSKTVTLCFLGIGALLLSVFASVVGTRWQLIVTAECFLILIVLAWLLYSWYVEQKKLCKLEQIANELPDKYLLGEVLPSPTNELEKKYFEIMKTVSRSAIGIVQQSQQEKEEYYDYVESWIHEIKTPLTACSLIIANDGDIHKLKRELKRADNLTESILYYARMRTAEKDTQIQKFSVAQVMDEAVKSQMELLIAAGIGVDVNGGFFVCSDAKAVRFVLNQLLVNCAKYCPHCHVTMTAENGNIVVEDNGIGIPSHELDRVTERGFTGTNGRCLGGSTGMGLYIVRELCKQLGINLLIESLQGHYTRISLSFNSLTKT